MTLLYLPWSTHSSQVAWVPQEPPLFPVSVRENIAYGMPACQQPDVEAAAKLANCHDFITKLPQGYETVLGNDGRTLALTLALALALALALTLPLPLTRSSARTAEPSP